MIFNPISRKNMTRSFIFRIENNNVYTVSGDEYISLFMQAVVVVNVGRLEFGAKAVSNPALALAFDLAWYLKCTSQSRPAS